MTVSLNQIPQTTVIRILQMILIPQIVTTGGAPTERYFKYIKGFSVLAYTMEGVYPAKEEGERGTEPK